MLDTLGGMLQVLQVPVSGAGAAGGDERWRTARKPKRRTPKKRRDERKKGNVFMSNDAVSVAVLIVGIAVLALSAPKAGRGDRPLFPHVHLHGGI